VNEILRESLAHQAAAVAAAKIGEARSRAAFFAEHYVELCFGQAVVDDDPKESDG